MWEFFAYCKYPEIASGRIERDNGSVFGLSTSGWGKVDHIRSYLSIIGFTGPEHQEQHKRAQMGYFNDHHNFHMNR